MKLYTPGERTYKFAAIVLGSALVLVLVAFIFYVMIDITIGCYPMEEVIWVEFVRGVDEHEANEIVQSYNLSIIQFGGDDEQLNAEVRVPLFDEDRYVHHLRQEPRVLWADRMRYCL